MKINCIIVDDEYISRLLIEKFVSKTKNMNLIASYSSAVEAINNIDEIDDIDLIFLDIEMPGMTGIEFITHFNKLPQIIIVSAQEKYAIDAIKYGVADYILKPISYARFAKAVERVRERIEKVSIVDTNQNDGVFIKENNSSYVRVKYSDILWIEALENYITITTEKSKYTIHFTMKSFETKLPSNIFIRLHRSYIVNYKKIEAIADNEAIIKHNKKQKKFPIAKTYREQLLEKLNFISK